MAEEARKPAAFGLVAVHRKGIIAASSGMRDVIGAAAERTMIPSVIKIKTQRRVRGDRGLQTCGRLPGAIAHARDTLAVCAGGMQRDAMAVAGDGKAVVHQAA